MIKKTLKSKSGMTLVELVVGMLIAAIIMTSASVILVPTLQIYKKANELAEMNTLLDNLANQIVNDFSTAKFVSFTSDGSAVITKTNDINITYLVKADGILYITYPVNKNGILEWNTMPVLEKGFYKNKEVLVEYYDAANYDGITELNLISNNPTGASEFIIRIILSENGGPEKIRRDYAVKLIILNQYN